MMGNKLVGEQCSDKIERLQRWKNADLHRLSIVHSDRSGESVRSKNQKLEHFKEKSHIDTYDSDFEDGDDFDLSYSKFSMLSAKSRKTNIDEDSVGRATSVQAQNVSDTLSDQAKNIRISDCDNIGINKNQYPSAIRTNVSSEVDHSPSTNIVFKNSTNLLTNDGAENTYFTPRVENSQKQAEDKAAPSINRTPEKRHKRSSSVKISMTPAQRYEKIMGAKSSTALTNFKFTSMIGRGAFADVYKGINLKTNQIVAIKQMKLDINQDVDSLMGEIDLLKILKHPNIVKYHGFVKTRNSLNIFLEYCPGGSLRQLYKSMNSGLPEMDVSVYVKQILQGLHYLHEQGVVHRDVKAANVLIAENQVIKLADFGVATKVNSQHRTVVGTPNWMAPETVLGGDGLCTQSDIWSLGATIIELLTTHPPYHNLNPMATLHAIGTEKHPDLPKGITPLAKDFLLECFQKQPTLRRSAVLLLKHKWISSANRHHEQRNNIELPGESLKGTEVLSEHQSSNKIPSAVKGLSAKEPTFSGAIYHHNEGYNETDRAVNASVNLLTKSEIINKFSDKEENYSFESIEGLSLEKYPLETSSNKSLANGVPEDVVDDPFAEISIDDVATKEIELNAKMEVLLTKLSNKIEICQVETSGMANSINKITSRVLHLLTKYDMSCDCFIREHGISTYTELLEIEANFPKEQKLWYNTLATLNHVFERSPMHFENFCLLGGIPLITQFQNGSYDYQVRIQVLRFVKFFIGSEKCLSMFVATGGLRDLCKYIEEDFDTFPEFPLVSIDCLHGILVNDHMKFKSTICRILSKYGVVFWFVVILNRLTKLRNTNVVQKVSLSSINESIDKIIEMLRSFSQSEARVRVKASTIEIHKLLIKIYPSLKLKNQLVVLKFFKSISEISASLKMLHSANILEFLVGIIADYEPPAKHYKEVLNIVCPIVYDCCYLNHGKEVELVKLGAMPLLKKLSRINLPFRQFILPLLCELVHCNTSVRKELKKNSMFDVYLALIIDPYWQSNALEAIMGWWIQNPNDIDILSPKALECFISGFLLIQVSNIESSLDIYLKFLTMSRQLSLAMFNDRIIDSIIYKLSLNSNNSVVQLVLLKILKCLVANNLYSNETLGMKQKDKIIQHLSELQSRKYSVLIDGISNEIFNMLE